MGQLPSGRCCLMSHWVARDILLRMFSLVISCSLAAANRVVEELIDPKIIIVVKNTKQADRKTVYSIWLDGLPVCQSSSQERYKIHNSGK